MPQYKDIIEHLYYPQSAYEFSVLPADILGHVYERFLGKVIRLTPGRQVKIEEKPEVRKAGGVYYTPTYIVDYIVRQTVGPLLEGKAPGPAGGASKLRILDAACGSGSFLLGAYQFLLDWHLVEYLKDPDRWLKGRRPPLERLYAQGYTDEVVDLTVRKLLERQVQKDEAQLVDLREDLTRFEQRYAMTSADFFARYQAGQMGDDADVFEWNALYRMHTRLADAVKSLRGQLRE